MVLRLFVFIGAQYRRTTLLLLSLICHGLILSPSAEALKSRCKYTLLLGQDSTGITSDASGIDLQLIDSREKVAMKMAEV